MNRSIALRVFVTAGLALLNSPAEAYIYWTGKIGSIFFSVPSNLPFRIYSDGTVPITGCRDSLAYADSSNPNYQVYVSSLTTAYAMGKTVTLTLSVDAQGFCVINEGSVSQ